MGPLVTNYLFHANYIFIPTTDEILTTTKMSQCLFVLCTVLFVLFSTALGPYNSSLTVK